MEWNVEQVKHLLWQGTFVYPGRYDCIALVAYGSQQDRRGNCGDPNRVSSVWQLTT